MKCWLNDGFRKVPFARAEYMAVPSQAPHSFWNLTWWNEVAVERWLPHGAFAQTWVYGTYCVGPPRFSKKSLSVKQDVSWKTVSPQCSFTEWSIGHFWHRPRKRFQRGLSHLVKSDERWRVSKQCCFTEWSISHYVPRPRTCSLTFLI